MAGYTSCVSVARCSTRCICRLLRGDVLGVVARHTRTAAAGVDHEVVAERVADGGRCGPPSRTILREGASTDAWGMMQAGRRSTRGRALPRRDAAYRTIVSVS